MRSKRRQSHHGPTNSWQSLQTPQAAPDHYTVKMAVMVHLPPFRHISHHAPDDTSINTTLNYKRRYTENKQFTHHATGYGHRSFEKYGLT